MNEPVCVIVGVGPGNGAACARRFVADGYRVAAVARNAGYLAELARSHPGCSPFPCDASDPAALGRVLDQIASELGPVRALVYNAGNAVPGSIESTSGPVLEACWRLNVLGCMTAVQRVLPAMRAAGDGRIVIIGATASTRGAAMFLPFASAKAAQRSLAQSIARALGPVGIHVAYVVVDGVIDLPVTRAIFPARPDDQFLAPDDVAAAVGFLAAQPRSAWTFELDLRPHTERW